MHRWSISIVVLLCASIPFARAEDSDGIVNLQSPLNDYMTSSTLTSTRHESKTLHVSWHRLSRVAQLV